MNSSSANFVLFAAGTLLVSATPVGATGPTYSFIDLGTTSAQSYARSINNAGQVAGYALPIGASGTAYRATLWNGATPTDLGTLGGSYSQAFGINSSGRVVGDSELSDYRTQRATVWNGASGTALNTPMGNHSEAKGINDANTVVGSIFSATAPRHATLWNGTALTDLGTLGGQSSEAYAINASGQIVGDSELPDYTTHATLWMGTTATDLGTLGGNNSTANDINNGGKVVGYSYVDGNSAYHATVWNGMTPTDLGTFGGNLSEANAINNSGLIAGWSETAAGVPHATLWNGSTATDLNTFLDIATINAGWVLERAYDINDFGGIAGDMRNTISNTTHAFVLSPIPEPEVYAMFMTGLGLMAGVGLRRRHKTI